MGSPDVSVLFDALAWPDDAARFVASLERHRGARAVELVEANQAPGIGYGAAHTGGLARASGVVVVLVDTSLELTGDLLGDLVAAFDDRTVAVAGPYGLATADLCDYEERTSGDVAAIQGYCLAARRADLVAIGGVQEAFEWYRNADIDVSLRLRTLRLPGLGEPPVRRAVATGAGHCTRHTHRAWEATPEAERPERSRRNMGLVHRVFFDRKDLTVR